MILRVKNGVSGSVLLENIQPEFCLPCRHHSKLIYKYTIMLSAIHGDYITAGISFIAVLLMLHKSDVPLWQRLLILFFIPLCISVFVYIVIKWDGVRSTMLDFNIPGLHYASFAVALGYGLGRVLIPGIVIYFSYCLIRIWRGVRQGRRV